MSKRIEPIPQEIFRYLCLATALANTAGNAGLYLFHEPVFQWLGVPLPADPFAFAAATGFSFAVGVLAYLVYRDPGQAVGTLVGVTVAKGLYALAVFYFHVFADLHGFYLVFGVWDAAYVIIFLLFLCQLVAPDLTALHDGALRDSLDGPVTGKALLLGFSLTGNVSRGLAEVESGLVASGYTVDRCPVEPVEEELFRFPLSLWRFLRIAVRAVFRRPARIAPLNIPADHGYDLIVVGAQTWMVGMSAVVEGVFEDPANRLIFEGRDVAVVTVCRGLWRRTQAMTVRWVQRCGGNVVGARAKAHVGREPSRLLSLVFYLIFREPGRPRLLGELVQRRYGMSGEALADLERFGVELAQRRGAPPTVGPEMSPAVIDRCAA